MSNKEKTLIVTQIASPIGRYGYQKKCLIGLGLNKINRTKVFKYNDSIFGMVKKVKHLVKYEIK
ncbi:MAG: 50S ribosomal protein L30 [Pseudomonadota bacterium]|nr:50S ribosomal protein L30 [Pseudomonadota bacterium]